MRESPNVCYDGKSFPKIYYEHNITNDDCTDMSVQHYECHIVYLFMVLVRFQHIV